MDNFIENCKKAILMASEHDIYRDDFYYRDDLYRSLNIVWFCKTLQNHKALVMSTHDAIDHIYWEVTYDGIKNQYYVDEYCKKSNTVITLSEV